MYESRRHTRPAPSSGRPWTSMAHILPDAWRMRRLPDSCSATIAWTTECPTVLARIGMSTLTAPVDSLLRSGRGRRRAEGTAAASQEPACRLRFAERRGGVVLSSQAHTLGVYRNRNTRRREDSGCRRVAAMTPDPAMGERARALVDGVAEQVWPTDLSTRAQTLLVVAIAAFAAEVAEAKDKEISAKAQAYWEQC